jgi:hypothetical protein
MPSASRVSLFLVGIFLTLAGPASGDQAVAQSQPAPSAQADQQPPPEAAETTADTQDAPDDELDTAAVTLDLSHNSPLI